ncbi:MAG: FtsX-like permease family protein, partial [Oscillospiraceae bacterium]
MKRSLYPKLALSSIRKNGRFYVPYILTCAGMVMMFYIIHYLAAMPLLDSMAGGTTTKTTLGMGTFIVALFALIFLFYTNSFLMRRRKKEFGLYNILGMSKGNLALVLLSETVIVGLIALAGGLVCGIALSKIAELALTRMLFGETGYEFYVNLEALADTLLLFAAIFALIFLNGLRQIHRSSAVSLLRSENVGEKPPRANYLLGFGGVIVLAAAYWLAVSIQSPLSALGWFFVAVAMVIAATYALFISGSVVLCRLLQKNKKYYYKKNHFVSVSSMAYRMKRNGAGLASVCILSTMVLVMIAGAGCLYFGAEDSLRTRYPKDIRLNIYLESNAGTTEGIAAMEEEIGTVLAAHQTEPQALESYRTISITGLLTDGYLELDSNAINEFDIGTYSDVCQVYFIPLADYNRCMGTSETLEPGQALIWCYRRGYDSPVVDVAGCCTLEIVGEADAMVGQGDAAMDIIPSVYLVVPDLQEIAESLSRHERFMELPHTRWDCGFDTDESAEEEIALADAIRERLREMNIRDENGVYSYYVECR